SGSTASSISGSSSIRDRFSRSIASACMTCTTVDGKYFRMSPSHRATRGAEALSPPPRPVPAPSEPARSESYRAASAASIAVSPPPSRCRCPRRPARHRAPAATGAPAPRVRPSCAPPQQCPDRRLDQIGPLLVDVGRRGNGPAVVAPAEPDRALADLAALRGRVLAESAPQQRQRLDERVRRDPGQPPVHQPQQPLVV